MVSSSRQRQSGQRYTQLCHSMSKPLPATKLQKKNRQAVLQPHSRGLVLLASEKASSPTCGLLELADL